MTIARNRALAEKMHDALNAQDLDTVVNLYAEDAVNHGRRVGRDGIRQVVGDIFQMFPDARSEIEDMIVTEDAVVVRVITTQTHANMSRSPVPIMGGLLRGVPATGRTARSQSIHIYKMRDGLITEHWANRDDLGMMQQLGLIPESLADGSLA